MEILLVEDGEQNINDAREALGDIQIAKSFAEFEEKFAEDKPKYVLSDLYFPTGCNGEKHEKLKSEAASILEDYIKTHEQANPIAKALELIFPNLKPENFDEHLAILKDPLLEDNKFKHQIREAYNRAQTFKAYKNLLDSINNNVHDLPSGIFVYKHCKNENVPCVIVTNAYHHGTEFQPFVSKVGNYFDNLLEGKKPWKKALENITRERK